MNYTALISGLVGALIGALSGLLTLVVQNVIPIWLRLTALLEPHTPAASARGLEFDEFVPVTFE